MKALELVGKEKFRFSELPLPSVGDHDCLLKIRKVGICGTDLHLYHGGMEANLPLVMGHEFVGDIAKVGAKVDSVKVGDRVTAEHVIGCGSCYYCQHGKQNLCVNPTVIGLQRPGALAEYLLVPEDLIHVLPDNLTYDQGVLVEPLSIAVYGVRRAGVTVGDLVAVVGQGPIGLFMDQVAKAAGAEVFGIDIMPARLDYAKNQHIVNQAINSKETDPVKEFRKLTESDGADIVFEVVGQEATAATALDLARSSGKVIVLGVFEHNINLNMMSVVKKELQVMGSWTCLNVFEPTITLLKDGQINTNGLITHRYPFEQAQQAFVDASSYSDNRIKTVIEFY